jgi:7-carboxy-7-deazaguanine synthase
MYTVKEIFYTLQGEGAQAGRPAVFLRFAGCNLWTGREQDRGTAICSFCDTDFVGTGPDGGRFSDARRLAAEVDERWRLGTTNDSMSSHPGSADGGLSERGGKRGAEHATAATAARVSGRRFVVCTGGEPLLQLDEPLIAALHERGFCIAIETNGTMPAPSGIDWICVSPKADAALVQRRGDELKLVFRQTRGEPERFADLDFRYFFLQPMDGPEVVQHTREAVSYCLAHPQWRLSLQTHKLLGIR